MIRYRTALITGASSGIGRSVARRLARDGVRVIVCARRKPRLDELVEQISAGGGEARAVELDVADTERTAAVIRAVDEETGGLDLVFACAGVGVAVRAARLTWEKIRQMCQVNFNGALATLCAALPGMVARRRGHLVGVSSLGALIPLPKVAGYAATKAGLSMFLESLRLDLKGSGVVVTCVQPGFVRTEMSGDVQGKLPMELSADEAADVIVDAMQRAPALIDFPGAMAAAVRAAAALPRPLRDAALLSFPGPEENA